MTWGKTGNQAAKRTTQPAKRSYAFRPWPAGLAPSRGLAPLPPSALDLPPADHDAGEGAQDAHPEDHAAEDEDLRPNAEPFGAVDPAPERHHVAADEVRGHEVVDGKGERHQRPGQDARHDERPRNLPERGPPVRAEVRGGLLQRPV